MKKYINYTLLLFIVTFSCAVNNTNDSEITIEENNVSTDSSLASVEQVTVSGSPTNYTFAVTISSPDTGCEQYADWWEIISEEGDLIHRRILAHSHVNEQPFTRSGSRINLSPDQQVWVRVHMNNSSYSTQGMIGSISTGFEKVTLPENFASDLETSDPLPSGCAF